jgi:alanine dehydrogenase
VILVLKDEEIDGLVPMDGYIAAMESAYAEYANGKAMIRPRQRYMVKTGSGRNHQTNIIGGAVPSCGLSAIRLNSWPRPTPGLTPVPGSSKVGLIVVFDLESGQLVGLLANDVISDMRVGATTAIAIRRLAPEKCSSIGVLGSGRQARANLEAICRVRSIRRAKVFSPNKAHRTAFAKQMSERLGIEITSVESSAECVKDVDIIGCFTSSNTPVFDGSLIRAGQTVVSIRNTDHDGRYDEVDQNTFLKSHVIAISDRGTLIDNKQTELLELMDGNSLSGTRVVELGDLVIGRARGREQDDQVVYYKNNAGMGVQFAASAKIVMDAARKKQVGTELPESVLDFAERQ